MVEPMTGGEFSAARKKLGYRRQVDLASDIGYTRNHVNRMERGKDDVPPLLAEFMRLSLAYQSLDRKYTRCQNRLAKLIKEAEALAATQQ